VRITVDCGCEIGQLDHFWQSTGFTPASLLLNADMRQAITYAGSTPFGGITYVRPHYLLELLTVSGLGTEHPHYDWTVLDAALDVLTRNGLKLFFELMGNPSGYFTDYLSGTQVRAWRQLVKDLALHLTERYGQSEVRSWYFETWNEPDTDFWKQSMEAFCNYYAACSQGLRDADEELRLGGPGTCRGVSDFLKMFLDHCDRGTNYFTGEVGLRLDFISVHEKGVRSCPVDLDPNTQGIVDREIKIIEHIRANYPRLADTPFVNNECDPQAGWHHVHTWRAHPYYAALACKIINQHLVGVIDGLDCEYALLSNDNGFIGEWGNRTLLTRFGDIEDVPGQSRYRSKPADIREDPTRKRFEMIKKPMLNVMALLSLLGNRRCAVSVAGDISSDVGVIATAQDKDQVAILLYHSQDRINSSGTERIELCLRGVPFDSGVLSHYRIDKNHTNPYRIWESMGAPTRPSPEQYAVMRENQELAFLEKPTKAALQNGELALSFDLPLPSASLVLLSSSSVRAPGKVEEVRAERYDGLTGQKEVMVAWRDVSSRALRTYEVMYADSPDGPYRRVNEPDLICAAYLHVGDSADERGYYKVRAVDYWARCGEESDVATD